MMRSGGVGQTVDYTLRVHEDGAGWWINQIGPTKGPFRSREVAISLARDQAEKLTISGYEAAVSVQTAEHTFIQAWP